jgi:hypothetical protein
MLNQKNLYRVVLLLVLCLFMVGTAHAFQTPTPTPPVASTVPIKIIAIAAVVTSVLQGVKKFIPQINGWIAVVLSVILAVAGTYATAAPGQVVSIQFLSTAILSALGANGIYNFAASSGSTAKK